MPQPNNWETIWSERLGEFRLKVLKITHSASHYCGYVAFDPVWASNIAEYDLNVHGGVTYSQLDTESYVQLGEYVVGFDCAHSGDTIEVQNVDYAITETRSLAEQLREQIFPRVSANTILQVAHLLNDTSGKSYRIAETRASIDGPRTRFTSRVFETLANACTFVKECSR
jgi:hypothetical protein